MSTSQDDNKEKIVRIQIAGESSALWQNLREKLLAALNKFLDTTIDVNNERTIRNEAKELLTGLLDYSKAKLQQPSILNEKIIAEIDQIYADNEIKKAEARKINAEAKSIEIDNSVKTLKISLGMCKALMNRNDSDDIIFIKQIDSFLQLLKAIEISSSSDDLVQ